MNPKLALEIAKKLGVLTDYPKSNEAVEQVADLILILCKSDAEAEWLLKELTLSGRYDKWEGPGWLKRVYDGQFGKSDRPDLQPYKAPEPSDEYAIRCMKCKDLGWTLDADDQAHLCECAMSLLVTPTMLFLASRKRKVPAKTADSSPMPTESGDFKRIGQADIEAAVKAAGR